MGLFGDVVKAGSFGLLDPDKGERDAMNSANAISAENVAYLKSLEVPELMWEGYSPDIYTPEDAQFQTISEDPAIRSAQMSALEKMSGLADDGMTAEDELGYYKSRQQGNQIARAGTQSAIQEAQNRGVSGGGMEFAMREVANQGGAQRAQEAALAEAADRARQRALYTQAYNTQLGNQRSQDLSVNKANTDIINQFNTNNTNARNAATATNVANKNASKQYNIEGKQGTQQQNYDNELAKRQTVTGANNQIRENYLAKGASSAQQNAALLGAGATLGGAYMKGGK